METYMLKPRNSGNVVLLPKALLNLCSPACLAVVGWNRDRHLIYIVSVRFMSPMGLELRFKLHINKYLLVYGTCTFCRLSQSCVQKRDLSAGKKKEWEMIWSVRQRERDGKMQPKVLVLPILSRLGLGRPNFPWICEGSQSPSLNSNFWPSCLKCFLLLFLFFLLILI